ncbi:hypothetical protein CAPTEDRAFT_35346, partial [Capitella teleta]
PLKGGWSWNDATNQLEYSSGISADRQNDRKAKEKRGQARGAGHHGHFQDGGAMKKQMEQRGGTPGSRAFGRQIATGGGQRAQAKRGKNAGEHTHITVEDVKEVSLNRLSEMETVSEAFEALAITPQFDEFLMYLLNYFHWFFEKRAQDTKPNPMNIEPSRAEIQLYAELCDKLESARKQLGRAYCVLILGIGLNDHHHMSCGQSRVSSTYKDRLMYETMYSFLTFLVWISFKRKEFEVVKKEIGRILRTDTFNPAIRVKMAPSNETPEETECQEKLEKKKLTPAEYRRLHGKRPPIKSIINQRSLVLVSIMPDPREEADWLFRRSGALSPTALSNIAREDLDDSGPSYSHLDIDLSKLKVGIIGEPCSQFNPITLTPLGVDTEEGEDTE